MTHFVITAFNGKDGMKHNMASRKPVAGLTDLVLFIKFTEMFNVADKSYFC